MHLRVVITRNSSNLEDEPPIVVAIDYTLWQARLAGLH